MVVSYLERMHHLMYEEKIKLEREYQKKLTLLKDNEKFIQTLEKSLDENYESFTPWKIYHESHKKIDSLGEEQKGIETEVQQLKDRIGRCNGFIKEIEGILEIARAEKKASLQKENKSFIEKKEVGSDLEEVFQKAATCVKYMNLDLMRCRLEMQTLFKMIEKLVEKYGGKVSNKSLNGSTWKAEKEKSGENTSDAHVESFEEYFS